MASNVVCPSGEVTIPLALTTNKFVQLANSPTKENVTSSLIPVVRVLNNLVSKVIPLSSTVQLNKILANNESL